MRRKRVTGRFYIFLLAIFVIVLLIVRPHLHFGTREAIIEPGSASYSRSTDAVIIRDEEVFSSGTIARVEYVAMENTLLNAATPSPTSTPPVIQRASWNGWRTYAPTYRLTTRRSSTTSSTTT